MTPKGKEKIAVLGKLELARLKMVFLDYFYNPTELM
jgi:hypothetical protein